MSHPLAQRVEALLRSLHGVQDARVELGRDFKPSAIWVVPASSASAKGLTRNVQSGLMAALRLAIEPRSIFIVPELPAAELSLDAAPAPGLSAQRRLVGIGKLGMPAGYKPPPRIEVLELHRAGDQLQCRVVVEVAGRRRTGLAEAGEEKEGAVTLAARATLDALRYVEPGEWIFEGAADVIIAGQRHIVVSICKSEDAPSLSGAAPVNDSVEHAVAIAVLNAAGLSGAVPVDMNRRYAQR